MWSYSELMQTLLEYFIPTQKNNVPTKDRRNWIEELGYIGKIEALCFYNGNYGCNFQLIPYDVNQILL